MATEVRGDPQAVPYVAYPAAVGVLVSGWIGHRLGLGLGPTLVAAVGLIILTASVAVSVSLHVPERSVRRTYLLFGRWAIRSEESPFEDITGVCFRPFHDGEQDRVNVGLRVRNGRTLWLRAFDVDEGMGPIGNPARAYARQVSRATGVPIVEPTG
jgi:hypothetical protein